MIALSACDIKSNSSAELQVHWPHSCVFLNSRSKSLKNNHHPLLFCSDCEILTIKQLYVSSIIMKWALYYFIFYSSTSFNPIDKNVLFNEIGSKKICWLMKSVLFNSPKKKKIPRSKTIIYLKIDAAIYVFNIYWVSFIFL